jgi:predicted RNase H-like nuclease (RuvC/YqgF family)
MANDYNKAKLLLGLKSSLAAATAAAEKFEKEQHALTASRLKRMIVEDKRDLKDKEGWAESTRRRLAAHEKELAEFDPTKVKKLDRIRVERIESAIQQVEMLDGEVVRITKETQFMDLL